jgi:hypothetical protein
MQFPDLLVLDGQLPIYGGVQPFLQKGVNLTESL